MNSEKFEEQLRSKAIVETIYDDTEGRRIVVMSLLDAFVAMNSFVREEREACAKTCEGPLVIEIDPNKSNVLEQHMLIEGARAGTKAAAEAIRERNRK